MSRSALTWLPETVAELAERHGVPGVAVGVLAGAEPLVYTHGVTSLDNPSPVGGDTLFQIGSNTKLYTATAALRLVERGDVDLDAPVNAYLPQFRAADPVVSTRITVRQLLTHTSGLDGDFPGSSGHRFCDEMLERYVEQMACLALLHEPGAMFSYCNSGYVLLGRVIEVVSGLPYVAALEELVLQPLGVSHTRVLPEEIMLFSAALGHLPDPATGEVRVAPVYVTSPACSPAGSAPAASVRDVLSFVAMHLNEGRVAGGRRVLEPATVALMQQPQVEVPALGCVTGWGL
ncbi:MAG: serine hydrolase domain-containing protein, partial [Mycobacteriales bacterium]